MRLRLSQVATTIDYNRRERLYVKMHIFAFTDTEGPNLCVPARANALPHKPIHTARRSHTLIHGRPHSPNASYGTMKVVTSDFGSKSRETRGRLCDSVYSLRDVRVGLNSSFR